ncbi:MAG: hypothetical protein K8R74_16450, partial [Bacteroidales bacterium]|nr:hypothetical protein [Bacteroidales bacterium]
VSDINLKEEIEKQDVVFLMITGRFLFKFGWNFIEDVYKLYGPKSVYNKTHDYKCKIWNYNVWFTNIIEDAKKRSLSLEEMLELAAEYVYSQENIEDFLMYKGPNFYAGNIYRNPSWFDNMEIKAMEYNIAVDTLIQREASNIFQTKYPEIFKSYNELKNLKFKIANDSLLLSDTKRFAKKYHLTLGESIQIKAEKMFQQPASNEN